MKAKHSVWKTKLAKTMFLMAVVLVAALFLGSAASAGLKPKGTVANDQSVNPFSTRADGLAPHSLQATTHQQQAPYMGRGYFYAYCAYDPSGALPIGSITFDTPDNLQSLGTGPNFMSGGDIDDFGNWYGVLYYGGIYAMGFDGSITLIASSIPMNGLAFNYANGLWYGCDSTNLYTVDITTGVTTTVGPLGAPNTLIGLACDKDGNMYAYDVLFSGMSSLYSVNTATGAATVIGSMGVGFLYAQDPAYDRDMDILYIAGYTQSGTSGLYTCDVGTGAVTLVGPFTGNCEVDAFAIPWQPIQYPHDISVQGITEPKSQNAAPITPIVKVKNVGLNTEYDVPINLLIGKELITGTVEDFEADNGSYIHAAKNTDNWQWGAPTSGPMGAHSGSNVWATVLNGPYPNSMWTLLMTPEFTVPSGATFNYWQWYQFESGWDGGNVKISTDGGTTFNLITPEGGYPGVLSSNPYMTGQPGFTGTGGTSWKQVNFDLSPYEGMEAIILWEAASDSSVTYAGWYIDDVGFTTTTWVNEYDQTYTIPVINPDQVMNLTFTTWTPADLGSVENTNINYNAEATNQMVPDNNTANDYKSKMFSLHFGYFHDVALTQITSPKSGLAQTQTPQVVLEDHGQNNENVNVNMVIGKAVYTTLLEEDFAGGVPPAGWGTNYPSNWISSNTNYAGGTAPEAQFYWSPSSVGEHLLYTMPIDTTGYTALLLKFKEYVNDYNSQYSLKIQTSTDGGATWSDAYVRAGGAYGPATTQVSLSAANGVGSDNFMIAWDMSGDSFNINYWYIDDVWLGLIDLVPEYDETVIVDINAGQTMNVTLPDWTPSDVPLANSIDYLVSASASINGLVPVVTEEFNNYVPGHYVLPTGWTQIQNNPVTWLNSAGTIRCNEGLGLQNEWVISPSVSTVGLASTVLQYYAYYYQYNVNTWVEVLGSIDGGATWPYLIKTYTATVYGINENLDITSWAANQPSVMIAFVFHSADDGFTSSYFYFDNFFLGAQTNVFYENFEGTWGPYGNNPPAGWTITTNEPTPVTWDNNNWHNYNYGGAQLHVARIYYSPVRSQDDSMITPTIDCSALTSVVLKFWSYYYYYGSASHAYVLGSTDGGVTWPYTIASYTTSHYGVTQTYDISSWAAGQSNVKIRFQYIDYDGLYWYFDDVKVLTGTTVYYADFSDYVQPSWGPLGWQTNRPTNWFVSMSTNYAGGTAPEAEFSWSPSYIGDSRLYTGPIDTSAYTDLTLKFNEYINDYNGDYTLKVQTSTDNITWNDAYIIDEPPFTAVTTTVPLTTADGIGSSTFRLAFDFSGDSFNINYWYLDNIKLLQFSPIDDGHPSDNSLATIITLSYEHDVGVTEILEPSAPGKAAKDLTWFTYGGDNSNSIGLTSGGTFEGAIRLTPTELAAFDGWTLKSVKYTHGMLSGSGEPATDGYMKIYGPGTATAPGALLVSEPFHTDAGNFVYQYDFVNPVVIDGTQDLWFSIEVDNTPAGAYPLGCDAGPAIDGKSDWVALSGAWSELQIYGLDYSWNHEIGVEKVVQTGNWWPGTYQVEGTVKNLGVTYPESNFDVQTTITNATNVVVYDETVTVTDTLLPGQSTHVTFPDITIENVTSAEGTYKLTMQTMLVGDDHPNNDKKTLTFTIQKNDTQAPITTAALSGTMGQNDWYVSAVTVTLSAIDPPEPRYARGDASKWPTGVNHTYYKLDAADWVEYTTPFQVTADGQHTVQYYSVDKWIPPNVEQTKSINFKIDRTAPTVSLEVTRISLILHNKWNFTATVNDPASGVVKVEFYVDDVYVGNATVAPWSYIYKGFGKVAQAIAYDAAGNSAMSLPVDNFNPDEYIPNEMNGQMNNQVVYNLG
jgi:hypothetical protein